MRPLTTVLALALVALTACNTSNDAPDKAPEAPRAQSPEPRAQQFGKAAMTPPKGDDKAANKVRAAQKAVGVQPTKADNWALLGQAWVRKARHEQRERLFGYADDAANKALSIDTNHRPSLVVRAMVLQQRHQFKEVLTTAKRAVELEPRDTNAWGLLGDAALELGDYEQAELAYQKMIDLYPNLASYSRVAWLRWIHGDVDGAAQMWTLALEGATPKDPEPMAYCLTERGHLEWFRGKLDTAKVAYDKALNAMPDHAGALMGRGRVNLAQGDSKAAVADLEASFKARRSEETWVWLAHAYRADGQTDKASEIEARLSDASDSDDPRSVSLYLTARNIKPARALELALKDAKDRGDLYTQDALAMAYFRNGKLNKAAEHATKALSTNPPDPRLLAHAGLIAAALGHRSQAVAHLDAALTLNPAFDPDLVPEVKTALAKLKSVSADAGGQP